MTLGRFQAGVALILKFLILRLPDNQTSRAAGISESKNGTEKILHLLKLWEFISRQSIGFNSTILLYAITMIDKRYIYIDIR